MSAFIALDRDVVLCFRIAEKRGLVFVNFILLVPQFFDKLFFRLQVEQILNQLLLFRTHYFCRRWDMFTVHLLKAAYCLGSQHPPLIFDHVSLQQVV